MSLLWEILVGILWQFDHAFNQAGSDLPLPGQIALSALAAAACLWAAWNLGGREAQSTANTLILVCIVDTPVLLLGAGEPLLAWALCLPVCAAALWVGNAPSSKERWMGRGAWILAFLAPAMILDNGASAALVLGVFAWTVGWAMRKIPVDQKSWVPLKSSSSEPPS